MDGMNSIDLRRQKKEKQVQEKSQSKSSNGGTMDSMTTNNMNNNHSMLEPSWASKLLVLLLIVAASLLVITLGLSLFMGNDDSESLVKEDQYQAVFLTNGQVYFGKLEQVNSDFVRLTDIYYLQVRQQVQPEQVEPGQAAAQQQEISLTKLGNELHGPEDEMFVTFDKIVFWENLKSSGQVSEAIADFQENGASNTSETSATPAATATPTPTPAE